MQYEGKDNAVILCNINTAVRRCSIIAFFLLLPCFSAAGMEAKQPPPTAPIPLAVPQLPLAIPSRIVAPVVLNNESVGAALPQEKPQLSPGTKSELEQLIMKSTLINQAARKKAQLAAKENKSAKPIAIQHGVRRPQSSAITNGKKDKKSDSGILRSDLPNVDLSMYRDDHDDSERLLSQAYQALMTGQMEVATLLYKKVLSLEPQEPSALFGLATIYQRSGQEDQARVLYTSILKRHPNNQEALNNFLVLVGEEAPESAIDELKKLETVNPAFSPIPAQIGMIYSKIGNLKKAVRYLNKAVLLSPDNITYRYNLAIILDRMGQTAQAIILYKHLIAASENGAILPGSSQKIRERLIYLSAK